MPNYWAAYWICLIFYGLTHINLTHTNQHTHNHTMTRAEKQRAKVLFNNTFKIKPHQFEEYGVYDIEENWSTDIVEVYICKETSWHYLYFTNEETDRYYMIIDRADRYFSTLEELKEWASENYFG